MNHHKKRYTMGDLPHMLSFAKVQGNKKNIYLFIKGIGINMVNLHRFVLDKIYT